MRPFVIRPALSILIPQPSRHPPFAIRDMKRNEKCHREINPARPRDFFYRQSKRQYQRHDPHAHRDAPASQLAARHQSFPRIQSQWLTQLPGTKIQQQDFSGNGDRPLSRGSESSSAGSADAISSCRSFIAVSSCHMSGPGGNHVGHSKFAANAGNYRRFARVR
jgi:hypothetical protein